jgi:hypothetical protein
MWRTIMSIERMHKVRICKIMKIEIIIKRMKSKMMIEETIMGISVTEEISISDR